MQRVKRAICLLLCFILLWNSTSYLAEAQDVNREEIETETDGTDSNLEDDASEVEQQNTEDEAEVEDEDEENVQESTTVVEQTMPVLNTPPDESEPEEPQSEVQPQNEEEPEDIFADKDIINNVVSSVDKVNRSITMQWEKVSDYTGLEAVVYKNVDRSDENPLVINIMDKVEDVAASEALSDEEPEEELSESDVKLQKVVLDCELMGDAFEDGVAYYIDLRPYNEVVWEVSEEETEELSDEVEAVEADLLEESEEPVKVKEYGNCLSAVVIFLAKPVVTVKAGDTQCTINWKTIKGAQKYELIDVATGKVIQTVTTNSAKVSKLKNSVKYTYQVRAIAELKVVADSEEIFKFESDCSEKVSGTTKIATPAKVGGLTITPYNLGAILKWNKVSGATQYEIYRYDTKTKKWKSIKKTTNTTYTNTKLTNKRKYTYKVRAIRAAGGKTATGAFSSTKSITAKKYVTGAVHPIYYKARVKSKTSLYLAPSGKAKAGYLKAGTKVTVLKRANGGHGRCYVKINGKGYWLARKKLSFYGGAYTSKDYTTAVKEEFINSSGYSSKTKYLLWISSYTQRVNLFVGSKGKWKLQKTYRCATGKYSTATLQGTYKINKKKKSSGGRTYWKYLSCFYGGTSFHTLLYRGGRIVDSRLGKPVSNSCVRMKPNEAKWIYNNVPKRTTVVSY